MNGRPVPVTVEVDEFFGHAVLTLRAKDRPPAVVSLADPSGYAAVARWLCEVATEGPAGKESP